MKLTIKIHQKCQKLAFLLPFVLDLGRFVGVVKKFRALRIISSSPLQNVCIRPWGQPSSSAKHTTNRDPTPYQIVSGVLPLLTDRQTDTQTDNYNFSIMISYNVLYCIMVVLPPYTQVATLLVNTNWSQ